MGGAQQMAVRGDLLRRAAEKSSSLGVVNPRRPKIKVKTTTKKRGGVMTKDEIEERNRIVEQVDQRNQQALQDGAWMDTIYGQLVLLVTLGLSLLLVIWEIYLNLFI